MARPCKYCQPESKPGKKYAELRASGMTMLKAAAGAGIPKASASDHDKHLVKHGVDRATRADEPRPPANIDPSATPLEQAKQQHEWLLARQAWASRSGIPEKETAQISAQVTSSIRLVARLSGALDVTEAQIVRSAPWARIETAMLDALRVYPAALKAVTEALERLRSEGR